MQWRHNTIEQRHALYYVWVKFSLENDQVSRIPALYKHICESTKLTDQNVMTSICAVHMYPLVKYIGLYLIVCFDFERYQTSLSLFYFMTPPAIVFTIYVVSLHEWLECSRQQLRYLNESESLNHWSTQLAAIRDARVMQSNIIRSVLFIRTKACKVYRNRILVWTSLASA